MNNNNNEVLGNEYHQIGMISITSANNAIEQASKAPMPKDLYKGLWREGELACLFADSNLGKSILAVQIAEEISKTQNVLYLDCELSDKQFQIRYSNENNDEHHVFPRNFYRATISPINENIGELDDYVGMNYEDRIIKDIERAALYSSSKIIIVDNLSFLCIASEKGDAAGLFMMKLVRLKIKYGWSLLIIAHTPKRESWTVISPDHLAGSKKLFNFFDTIFAIGKCRKKDNLRYIKQLKVRTGEFTYTEDNVMICELGKSDGINLVFSVKGYGTETEQLSDSDNEEDIKKVCELRQLGLSIREIAAELKMKKSTVGRLSQRCKEEHCMVAEYNSDAEEEQDNDEVNDEDEYDD